MTTALGVASVRKLHCAKPASNSNTFKSSRFSAETDVNHQHRRPRQAPSQRQELQEAATQRTFDVKGQTVHAGAWYCGNLCAWRAAAAVTGTQKQRQGGRHLNHQYDTPADAGAGL